MDCKCFEIETRQGQEPCKKLSWTGIKSVPEEAPKARKPKGQEPYK